MRELRPAEEVFDSASLDSLRAVTVTIGHPAVINSDNWRELSVGHVGDNVRADDIYVAGDLIIKDPSAQRGLDGKDYAELSCGYSVELDFTPGEYQGQKYDAIQRNIRYNHVGIGGTDWGRAGPQVRVLDGTTLGDMSTATKEIRTDAPATSAPKTDDATQAKIDSLTAERDTARTNADTANAKADAATAKADKLQAQVDELTNKLEAAEKETKTVKDSVDVLVGKRLALLDAARSILGADFKADGLSDRDIRVAAIKKHDAKFDEKDRADGYIEARFDLIREASAPNVETLVKTATATSPAAQAPSASAPAKVSIEDAQKKMNEKNANAWTKPIGVSA